MVKLKTKILVTGGTGFIGSYLIEELKKLNFDIRILTQERLKGKQYIHGDIRDKDLNLKRYNIIYHLAAFSSAKFCEENKKLAWDVNVNGTLNLLDRLEEGQKIIFASSAHVYSRTHNPHNEAEPLKPSDFYGLTKKTAEELIEYYGRKKGFPYVILRFFNIYGPRQNKGFLIPDIMEKYKTGEEIKIIDPDAMRDFVYISDAVSSLIKAIKAQGTYNIASGRGTKIREIYSLIKKEISAEGFVEKIIKYNEDAIIADPTKAEKELGWKPKVSLEEGIRKIVTVGVR